LKKFYNGDVKERQFDIWVKEVQKENRNED